MNGRLLTEPRRGEGGSPRLPRVPVFLHVEITATTDPFLVALRQFPPDAGLKPRSERSGSHAPVDESPRSNAPPCSSFTDEHARARPTPAWIPPNRSPRYRAPPQRYLRSRPPCSDIPLVLPAYSYFRNSRRICVIIVARCTFGVPPRTIPRQVSLAPLPHRPLKIALSSFDQARVIIRNNHVHISKPALL